MARVCSPSLSHPNSHTHTHTLIHIHTHTFTPFLFYAAISIDGSNLRSIVVCHNIGGLMTYGSESFCHHSFLTTKWQGCAEEEEEEAAPSAAEFELWIEDRPAEPVIIQEIRRVQSGVSE